MVIMRFIQRTLYFQLKKHLQAPEISLILGPRQSGKTTLIEKLQEELRQQSKPTVNLNLDVIEDRRWFSSQHVLLDLVEKTVGKGKSYVFIDEISRLPNAGLFLKGLFDLKSGHKFIVTGSGSLELKADIVEPLTGRKQVFYCFPLSFAEFVAYKTLISFTGDEELYGKIAKKLLGSSQWQRLVSEYLNFGGYPRVVLAETEAEKVQILKEIYSSYLEKDIGLLLGIEKEQAFENLVKVLAHQVGNLVNYSELSMTLGLTERTVKRYLYLLEKTFVIHLVKPFYRNARKELVKSPKVFFVDLGFLQIAQGILPTIEREPMGNVFENACLLRLKELDLIKPPQFWRTKGGAEVDYVIISPRTGCPLPIEVKTSLRSLGKSLISFINIYQPKEAFVYIQKGRDQRETRWYRNTKIGIVPYHESIVLLS